MIITAYSELYETKTVTVFIKIAEIPSSLLLIDAGEYNNITAYEGETIEVAVGYWDSFHGNPILFNDPAEGNLSWEIAGTSAQGLLEKSVWQYETDISLPIAVRFDVTREPLSKLDVAAVRVADLSSRIGFGDLWSPYDLHAFGLEVGCRLGHVVNFKCDHPIAEVLLLWRRLDRSTLIRD